MDLDGSIRREASQRVEFAYLDWESAKYGFSFCDRGKFKHCQV